MINVLMIIRGYCSYCGNWVIKEIYTVTVAAEVIIGNIISMKVSDEIR